MQVLEGGELGQAQAFGDVPAGVVADGQLGELVGRGDAAVEGAGAFGGLGGVLGDVGGDLAIGEFPGGGDRAGVEFAAPRQSPCGQSWGGGGLDVDGAGGLGDGVGEQGEGGPGGRGGGRSGGAVEADDRVEVDDPAALVFGDLGVGEPGLGGERLAGEPGLAGEGAAQGDGEAAPQFGGAGVEQDRAGVVVAVRAQRFAELVVVRGRASACRTCGRREGRPGRFGGDGRPVPCRRVPGGRGRGRRRARSAW